MLKNGMAFRFSDDSRSGRLGRHHRRLADDHRLPLGIHRQALEDGAVALRVKLLDGHAGCDFLAKVDGAGELERLACIDGAHARQVGAQQALNREPASMPWTIRVLNCVVFA